MFKLLEDWVQHAISRGWFKAWHNKNTVVQGEVTEMLEEAGVEPIMISEPDRSIVQCYLDNPGRWKITRDGRYTYYDSYSLLDKETGEEFRGCYWAYPLDKFICPSHTWISNEEVKWAWDTIKEFSLERAAKLRSLRNQRQRKRLMKMYVKGINYV